MFSLHKIFATAVGIPTGCVALGFSFTKFLRPDKDAEQAKSDILPSFIDYTPHNKEKFGPQSCSDDEPRSEPPGAFKLTMMERNSAPFQGPLAQKPSFVPTLKWNPNWDFRDPRTQVDKDKFESSTEDEKQRMIVAATPTAARHIFLIRHGQYDLNSKEHNLSETGREQASILGQYLNGVAKLETSIKFHPITVSTMTRAKETAEVMLQNMDKGILGSDPKFDLMLEEGAPFQMEPALKPYYSPTDKELFVDSARIEAAFRKYIHRAPLSQKNDSYELYVCHGNVIRYFVCRALQLPPEVWLRLSLPHTSITWLTIRPNGIVTMRAYGDFGHLPPSKITFS